MVSEKKVEEVAQKDAISKQEKEKDHKGGILPNWSFSCVGFCVVGRVHNTPGTSCTRKIQLPRNSLRGSLLYGPYYHTFFNTRVLQLLKTCVEFNSNLAAAKWLRSIRNEDATHLPLLCFRLLLSLCLVLLIYLCILLLLCPRKSSITSK